MFRRTLRRSLWFRFLLVGAFLVAAVGVRHWWREWRRHPFVAPLATPPIFADEFEGVALNPITRSRLDPLRWQVQGPEQILQRTQWGRLPLLQKDADGTSYARLSLDTFDPRPEKAGRFHLSTQITSLDRWKVGNGLEFETRLRADHLPPGLILGFFAYGDAGVWKNTYQKTEADFELLTHQGGKQVWTHVWDNWNPLRLGANDGSMWGTAGTNWNNGSWNIFKIRWYPNRTEWILNNRLIRSGQAVRPGSPMGVWFNLWAPNPDWLDAYDAAIQPAPTAKERVTYAYDIDYVRVRRIPPAPLSPGDSPSAIGEGEGLQGSYFPTPNLTGRAVVRLDPRVDFNWGRYAPAASVGADDFSVRWEGQIEARFSQVYTFSVSSDDGARLWVNGRLLIDNWQVQALSARAAQITLRAGERVPIRLEIFNRSGNASAQLRWRSPSTPFEIVPQSQLYVPARPAAPRFTPQSRALQQAQDVKIETPTRGAVIHYTLDGAPPTRSSRTLPNGGALRVKYTALVRAGAFLEREVPSETTRAFYVLDDKTPPHVAFAALASEPKTGAIAPLAGTASDDGSGVTRLDLVIIRLADGLRWKEGQWVAQEWGIGAKIENNHWSVSAGLPPQSALRPGKYELKAVAYDLAGNIKSVSQRLSIAESAVSSAIGPKTRQ